MWNLVTNSHYVIRGFEFDDLEAVRIWRNAQIDVLRQAAPLSEADQRRWWDTVYLRESAGSEPQQTLYTLLETGRAVAYGGFTNCDWVVRRAELSFLADDAIAADQARYEIVQRHFFVFLLQHGFGEQGFQRLFTETYDFRKEHIDVLEELGLREEGRLRRHAWARGGLVDSLMHGALVEQTSSTTAWQPEGDA
jgi:RimJ/RimL family protein N-acetyltransferase